MSRLHHQHCWIWAMRKDMTAIVCAHCWEIRRHDAGRPLIWRTQDGDRERCNASQDQHRTHCLLTVGRVA